MDRLLKLAGCVCFGSLIAFGLGASSPPVMHTYQKPVSSGVLMRGNVELLRIPAGEFMMGGSHGNEQPQRRVFLDAYAIGRTPVTVGQFRSYCESVGIDFKTFKTPSWGWIDNHPMVNVSWQQARDFCKWAGGDLPTEAQWEKAARGTDGREFPWGNDFDLSRLWCSKSVFGDAKLTAPVGSIPSGRSPYGCLDMVGDVWHWCLDYYVDGYYGQPDRNPKGPAHGRFRALRGGSWAFIDAQSFRCPARWQGDPVRQDDYLGFRMACPLR